MTQLLEPPGTHGRRLGRPLQKPPGLTHTTSPTRAEALIYRKPQAVPSYEPSAAAISSDLPW